MVKIMIKCTTSTVISYLQLFSDSAHQQREMHHYRGHSNGGLFHRQRDAAAANHRLTTAETAVAALRPSSAPQQLPRRDGMDQWRRNRVDQWQQRRIGEPGGRGGGGGSQEEKLFLNGWSNQFLSSQDISLHVVSQV
jgi:hypothetical protein